MSRAESSHCRAELIGLAVTRAYYLNGELVSATGKTAAQGGDVEPKAAAANDGTMITVRSR